MAKWFFQEGVADDKCAFMSLAAYLQTSVPKQYCNANMSPVSALQGVAKMQVAKLWALRSYGVY